VSTAQPHADLPFSPAAERNSAPWLAVLQGLLPARAQVLELASGTGQHAAFCADAQPGWHWQPSERDAEALPWIARRCAGLPNVAAPLQIDLLAAAPLHALQAGGFDAVVAMNLLHIAPWPVCAALMHLAAQRLAPAGCLVVYGPFIVDGQPTAPSNLAFDADLRARNPSWGLRTLVAVQQQAAPAGLVLQATVQMPANNLSLVFRHAA
jgi:hypothetical protein